MLHRVGRIDMFRNQTLLIGALVLAQGAAVAADLPAVKSRAEAASPRCEDKLLAPSDGFGFAAGAGVAAPGDRSLGLEYALAWGARGGSGQAHGLKAQASFGAAPCLEVGPSLFFGTSRASDRAAGTVSTTRAVGAGVEVKYALAPAPGLGVTLVVEPTYAWSRSRFSDPATPLFLRGDGPVAGATAKLIVEKALVSESLFVAFNLEQGASFVKDNGVDSVTASGAGWTRSSSLTARVALTAKIADWTGGGLYVGVDAAHQRAYEGAFLNRRPGWAWFAGPNLFAQLNDKVSLNLAWSTQLRGRAAGQTAGALDLDDFSRHIAKVKLGVGF